MRPGIQARDAKTGELLWQFQTGFGAEATNLQTHHELTFPQVSTLLDLKNCRSIYTRAIDHTPGTLDNPVCNYSRNNVPYSERAVTFRYKDYRRNGRPACTMTLSADDFIMRFLLHVPPKRFHRIRHYGLPASASCKASAPGS